MASHGKARLHVLVFLQGRLIPTHLECPALHHESHPDSERNWPDGLDYRKRTRIINLAPSTFHYLSNDTPHKLSNVAS